jgi:uncharacterized protein (TIGR00255 family)
MTLQSMTGFARAAGQSEGTQWTWEIKSVNGRGLDLKFRLPPVLEFLDVRARAAIGKRIQRGSLQIQLVVQRPPRPAEVRIDTLLLASLQRALVEGGIVKPDAPVDLSALLAIRGVVTVEEPLDDSAFISLAEPVLATFDEAVEALARMREAEGGRLFEVLQDRVAGIESLAQRADNAPGRKSEAVRARIETQLATLLDESATLDPTRLYQEAILIAGKADIREEIDRLLAHCAAAKALIDGGGPIGRKLDFLSQEFVREANTLCAKSNDVELTAIGLDLKAIIEQLREQVQNIE